MAQVSFEIKYYFDAKGQDWADIPTEQLDKILENCRSGISLNFDSPLYPVEVEINGVDNYSEIPNEAQELGCDRPLQFEADKDDSLEQLLRGRGH